MVLKPFNHEAEAIAIMLQQYLPFMVLKLYIFLTTSFKTYALQQYLPFMVLKHVREVDTMIDNMMLQQYLPFAVLKQSS